MCTCCYTYPILINHSQTCHIYVFLLPKDESLLHQENYELFEGTSICNLYVCLNQFSYSYEPYSLPVTNIT